jgi:hypothetical protein
MNNANGNAIPSPYSKKKKHSPGRQQTMAAIFHRRRLHEAQHNDGDLGKVQMAKFLYYESDNDPWW